MNRKFAPVVCAGLWLSTMAFGQGGGQAPPSFDVFQVKPISGSVARAALGASSSVGDDQGQNGQGQNGQGQNGQGGSGTSAGGTSSGGTSAGQSGGPVGQSLTSLTLSHWSYSVKAAQNGKSYSGNIVGANPSTVSSPATVQVVLVPVIFKITQGGKTYTFDPTAADSHCLAGGNAFALTQASPVFTSTNFSINGQAINNTTYGDAVLQAEFWTLLGKTSKQLLSLGVVTGPALTITVSAGTGGNSTGTVYSLSGSECGVSNAPLAVVNLNTVDATLQHYISTQKLGPAVFPFFVTYNAVMSQGAANNMNNCCILGYHNAVFSYTYGIGSFDGYDEAGSLFGAASADVSAISHEINEWINDPGGSNPTPSWGKIGQVSGCQYDFEVGDPLSGTSMPTVNLGGFNYHLQELAFFSWFYGGTSLGTGGEYSTNGTFKGQAKLCPPGGTN